MSRLAAAVALVVSAGLLAPASPRTGDEPPAGRILPAAAAAVGPPQRASDGPAATAPPASPLIRYRPPVSAPVADRFRLPEGPYGPGNRGWEYATEPGTPVRAVAPGVVTFAGAVAGVLFVVVSHADGLRSTYGLLARVGVSAGAHVESRAVVGWSYRRLHLGFRRGGDYVDPARLLGPGAARLVPDASFPDAGR